MPSGCIDCPKCGRYQCFEIASGRCLYMDCRYSPEPTKKQDPEERMKVIEEILERQNLLMKIRYCVVYTFMKESFRPRLNLGVVVWFDGTARGKFIQDQKTLKRTERTLLGRDRAENLKRDFGHINATDPDVIIPSLDDGDLRFTWPSAEQIYPKTMTIEEILEELFQKHVQKRS
ncbi:unnamed protein product [marine sediment metagenome]|uniref:Uncharacterized protein n=1 Tax=marine sediment metagenome TaxID=412755 RepID=X1M1Y0_9ZZZZ